MSSYETIKGRTMTIEEEPEVDYSGVSVSDDRPGQYRVYWQYNPTSAQGGITGTSWPGDILSSWGLQNALNNLDGDNPQTIDDVSAIIYNYTTNLLSNGSGEEWQTFRDTYKQLGCLIF